MEEEGASSKESTSLLHYRVVLTDKETGLSDFVFYGMFPTVYRAISVAFDALSEGDPTRSSNTHWLHSVVASREPFKTP